MDKKHQVHNLIILDESASMYSIKSTIIRGFNEVVQTIRGIEQQFPDQQHSISLVSFNGLGQKVHHFKDKAENLNQIDDKSYQPASFTPLFDALGFSFKKLKHTLHGQTDYNVLVTILTDGEENSSRKYSGNDIKTQIEELKENRWTFTYIGTDHDIEKVAHSLSIDNTFVFEKNETDINAMFSFERKARTNFSRKIELKSNLMSNYFDDTEINDVHLSNGEM